MFFFSVLRKRQILKEGKRARKEIDVLEGSIKHLAKSSPVHCGLEQTRVET